MFRNIYVLYDFRKLTTELRKKMLNDLFIIKALH